MYNLSKKKRDKSSAELRELLDLSDANLTKLIKAGLPRSWKDGKARFDEAEAQAFISERPNFFKKPKAVEGELSDLAGAKLSKEKELLRRYRRSNDIEQGRLLGKDECARRSVGNVVAFRNRLVGLSASLVPQLDGDHIDRLAIVTRAVAEILQSFQAGCVNVTGPQTGDE